MSEELFSLGEIYPSDFLKEGETPATEKVELKLMRDDNGLIRLEKTAPLNKMYGKYWYRSGINQTMRRALLDVVNSVLKMHDFKKGDKWLDIACNDGTLLSFVPKTFTRIGVDPVEGSIYEQAKEHCEHHEQTFFSSDIFGNDFKANVVTSIAMFYDVPDPVKFIRDVHSILHDDGLWVIQLSYSPLMIRQLAFDNICHEHIYYYSLGDLKLLLEQNGFAVVDCQLNDVNGGSFRVYAKKMRHDPSIHSVEHFRIHSILALETGMRIDEVKTWKNFYKNIVELKRKTVSFIKAVKADGLNVWAYGASTKGNTLLQYFGFDNTMIDGIADRNPDKWGLRTIGSNIPIFSEEDMRKSHPDYLLILPWHFIKEFTEREIDYLKGGGKFIVPCPDFKIISYDDLH